MLAERVASSSISMAEGTDDADPRSNRMIAAPKRIPVAAPSITEREVELAAEAARTAWRQNHYAYNARFERMLADYVGVAHAVSVPHATAALHLALAALGVGPGDEVIAPDATWIASVAPIVYVGAEPVLVDILADTWCIDPERRRGGDRAEDQGDHRRRSLRLDLRLGAASERSPTVTASR